MMCSVRQRCVTSVILFRVKAAGGQLTLLPIATRRRSAVSALREFVSPDQLIVLGAVQCTLDPQDSRQRHHDIAIGR
jgi:hypothetical protein